MKNKILKPSLKGKRPDKLLELEKLIVEFSTGFANAPISEIDEKIRQALKKIAECIDLGRCSLWEASENNNGMIISHQYVVPGYNKINIIDLKDFPWIFEHSSGGKYLCLQRLEDLLKKRK